MTTATRLLAGATTFWLALSGPLAVAQDVGVELQLSTSTAAQGEPVLLGVRVVLDAASEAATHLALPVLGVTVLVEVRDPNGQLLQYYSTGGCIIGGIVGAHLLQPKEGSATWLLLNSHFAIGEPGLYAVRATYTVRDTLVLLDEVRQPVTGPAWRGVADSDWQTFQVRAAEGDSLRAFEALRDERSGLVHLELNLRPAYDFSLAYPSSAAAEYGRFDRAISAPRREMEPLLLEFLENSRNPVLRELAAAQLAEHLAGYRPSEARSRIDALEEPSSWVSDRLRLVSDFVTQALAADSSARPTGSAGR